MHFYKQNRGKSIFSKLFFVMMAFFVSVNLTMILYSIYLFRNIQDKMNQESQNAMRLYVEHLDNTLQQLENVLYNMHGTYSVNQLCGGKSVGNLQWNLAQNVLLNDYDETIWLYADLSCLFSYYAFDDDYEFIIRSVNQAEQWNNLVWKERVNDYIQKQKDQHEYAGINWVVTELNDTAYLGYLRKRGNCYYGALINLDSLLQNWDIGSSSGYRSFFESGGAVVGQAQSDLTEQKEDDIRIEVASNKTDLVLVQEIPVKDVFAQIPGSVVVLIILGTISIAAIPVIYLLVSKDIRQPLEKILEGIRHVEEGDLDYRIAEDREQGEFSRVNRNFNSMVAQINNLKITAYERQLENQRIQMRYLTKQIQPHFILNALNILYSYEPEEYPLIQKMILCLAKYFRYIVKVDQPYVPLYQEIEHIRNYFKIQEARYPEIFYPYVEMEEGTEEALVPPLLIQNFTENSIKYALQMGHKISIYVLVEKIGENRMRIRIADTGKGMPQEALDAIERFKKEKKYQKELGIGIQNAIERLEIIYHENAKISIYNSEAGGATVDITMSMKVDNSDIGEGKEDGSSFAGG